MRSSEQNTIDIVVVLKCETWLNEPDEEAETVTNIVVDETSIEVELLHLAEFLEITAKRVFVMLMSIFEDQSIGDDQTFGNRGGETG